jgi:hypothetical protein
MAIHVLVAVVPALLEEIVIGSLGRQHDLRITLADGTTPDGWVKAASQTPPNIVITTAQAGESSADFLLRHPRTKVLALKNDGRNAFLVELKPECRSLGELSPADLVTIVRAAADDTISINW